MLEYISENMSAVLVDLPSAPQQARIRSPEGSVLEATGFQSTLYARGQYPKNRRRQRVMHDIAQKSSVKPTNKIIAHFQKEAER